MIQHSSGTVISRCVAFAEEQISGLQLIQRSGVEHQAQTFGSMGTAVCQLDNEPSPVPADCFGSGPYWQYAHRQGARWQTSALGAGASMLHDGDMDGWRYAAGAGQTPANLAFTSVCSAPPPPAATTHAASAPAAVRATPTATAPPTATSTPAPTNLEAAAPSVSTSGRSVLAITGSTSRTPKSAAIWPWLLVGGAATLLLSLGVVNLRRRGP